MGSKKANWTYASWPGSRLCPVQKDEPRLDLRSGDVKAQYGVVLYGPERELQVAKRCVDAARHKQRARPPHDGPPVYLLLFDTLEVEGYALACAGLPYLLVVGLDGPYPGYLAGRVYLPHLRPDGGCRRCRSP